MMTRFLFSVILLFSYPLIAQNNPPIQLQSGTFYLQDHSVSLAFNPALSELVSGHYYRVFQFHEIPNQELKKHLETSGIEFLSYLPKNAYVVSLPQNFVASAELLSLLAGATPVLPKMKYSSALEQQTIPSYAQDGDRVKILALIYPNINKNEIDKTLQVFALSHQIDLQFYPNQRIIETTVSWNQINKIAALTFVSNIQTCEAPAVPENFTGVSNHRVNAVSSGAANSFGLTGKGVVVGHGDDGDIGPHIDYKGRLTSLAGASNGNHGDHVAGTIFGAGNLDPKAQGMAPEAELIYYDYPDNLDDIDTDYNSYGIRITNSSYSNGCNAGYTFRTQSVDQDVNDMPDLIHVFSAGNDGNSNCGYGAGSGWGNITGGHKQGKNVIATGNVMYTDVIANSSSRGPAHDGRIKPDICAVGTNVYSCNAGNLYGNSTGTSMSCPGMAGVTALFYEFYNTKYNTNPESGLAKAILMNTAEDLGNPGPDFIYGYGRVNVLRAIETVDNEQILTDSVAQNEIDQFQIQVPTNTKEIRVMLYWTDPEANVSATRSLVNNLNLKITNPANTTFLPWVLNPTPNVNLLNANAVRAVDTLNNAEQITITNPAAGQYQLEIEGSGIPFGPQKYFVVYYFVQDNIRLTHPFGGETWDPTETHTIRWDATEDPGTFDLQYSLDNGLTWAYVALGIPANQNYYNWKLNDSLHSGQAKIRLIRGNDISENLSAFSILEAPKNLKINWACGDSLHLSWKEIKGAQQYVVYQLGNKFMEPIDTFSTNKALLKNIPSGSETWLSVSALNNQNAYSKRAIAIRKTAGFQDCPDQIDAGILSVIGPQHTLSSCQNLSTLSVTVWVKNYGITPLTSVPVQYQANGGTPVSEMILITIAPQDSVLFTFNQKWALSGTGPQTLEVKTTLAGDANTSNNAQFTNHNIYNSNTVTLPYTQNFDAMTICGTATNCESTVCTLSNGWVNTTNLLGDDHDWRVDAFGTTSTNTGPSDDVTGGGKYIYLEASGGCTQQTALLLSPCIDLTNAQIPELQFSYHMYGSDMGSLHLDVIVDGVLIEDVMEPIYGNQGNAWINQSIYLQDYIGKKINLQFRGITGQDFRSDLALDEIVIKESNMSAPTAAFNANTGVLCATQQVVYTSTSQGTALKYNWDFGPQAIPQKATTAGPVLVTYKKAGNFNTQLIVENFKAKDSVISAVQIDSVPLARYVFNMTSSLNFQFNDFSKYNPTAWFWDFGDGSQSNLQNPTHTYAAIGTYTLTLVTTNACGSDTLINQFYTSDVSLNENLLEQIRVYPNPTKNELTLERTQEIYKALEVEIYNTMGQKVFQKNWNTAEEVLKINTANWSSGVYQIHLKGTKTTVFKIIKT